MKPQLMASPTPVEQLRRFWQTHPSNGDWRQLEGCVNVLSTFVWIMAIIHAMGCNTDPVGQPGSSEGQASL